LKRFRKPREEALVLLGFIPLGLAAAVWEHGTVGAAHIAARVVYVGCLITLGFALWRAVTKRALRLSPAACFAAAYTVAYALVAIAFGWPLAVMTAVSLMVPAVVLVVINVSTRSGSR
jgi:ABC-type Co2+ transport system permease subunit